MNRQGSAFALSGSRVFSFPDDFFCFMDAANYAIALENDLPAEDLEKTIAQFNSFVENGENTALGTPVAAIHAVCSSREWYEP